MIKAKDSDFRSDNAFARLIILLYFSANDLLMTKWKSMICMVMLAVAASSCGEKSADKTADKPASEEAYQCPMKCTEPVAEPGKCPKCGMDMEKVSPS